MDLRPNSGGNAFMELIILGLIYLLYKALKNILHFIHSKKDFRSQHIHPNDHPPLAFYWKHQITKHTNKSRKHSRAYNLCRILLQSWETGDNVREKVSLPNVLFFLHCREIQSSRQSFPYCIIRGSSSQIVSILSSWRGWGGNLLMLAEVQEVCSCACVRVFGWCLVLSNMVI